MNDEQATTNPTQNTTDLQNASDVVNPAIYESIRNFIMDNHANNDGEMLEAYIVLRVLCVMMENVFGLDPVQVFLEEEQA